MSQLAAKSATAPDSLAKSTASIAEPYFREFSTAGDGCNPFDEKRCLASFLWSWENELGQTVENKMLDLNYNVGSIQIRHYKD